MTDDGSTAGSSTRWGAARSRCREPTTWRCSTSTASVYVGPGRRARRRRAPARRPPAPGCGWPTSPTTPPAPRQVGRHLASSACRRGERRRHLRPGGRAAARRAVRARLRGLRDRWGRAGQALRGGGPAAGVSHRTTDPVAVVSGVQPRPAAGGRSSRAPSWWPAGCPGWPPTPTARCRRRAGRARATACWSGGRGVRRGGPGGGRQARAAAVRGDPCAGSAASGRWSWATGSTPTSRAR